jgi:hypothetical protein
LDVIDEARSVDACTPKAQGKFRLPPVRQIRRNLVTRCVTAFSAQDVINGDKILFDAALRAKLRV